MLVAVYGSFYSGVSYDVSHHLQTVFFGKLTVFFHLFRFDPFQSVILPVRFIAVPHESSSGSQAAVLEQFQRSESQPGISFIFAFGKFAFLKIFFKSRKVVEAHLMPVAYQCLALIVYIMEQRKCRRSVHEGSSDIVALHTGDTA